jgi:hypothetical protein
MLLKILEIFFNFPLIEKSGKSLSSGRGVWGGIDFPPFESRGIRSILKTNKFFTLNINVQRQLF